MPLPTGKRLLTSNENMLGYLMYYTLREVGCPRTINEICFYSNILKTLPILKIERFFDLVTPMKRLKSVTAKYIIETHLPYSRLLNRRRSYVYYFNDVKQMAHKLGWQTSRGHNRWLLVVKRGDISWTLLMTSRGQKCPREVLFLGEFLWTFFGWILVDIF